MSRYTASDAPKPAVWRRLGLGFIVAWFFIGGVFHFIARPAFVSIVPPYVPDPEFWVLFTGVCEIAGAVGVLIPKLRRIAGLALIALTICDASQSRNGIACGTLPCDRRDRALAAYGVPTGADLDHLVVDEALADARRHAAVDGQEDAGDVFGFVGSKEERGICRVPRIAHARIERHLRSALCA